MTRTAHIKRDRQERFNLKRGWVVTAWRLVNAKGQDMVQPWFDSKPSALDYAKTNGIDVVGEAP